MDRQVPGGAGAGAPSAGASQLSDATDHPSTTTISTIAIQAGKAKIVLVILRVSVPSTHVSLRVVSRSLDLTALLFVVFGFAVGQACGRDRRPVSSVVVCREITAGI